MKSPMVVKLRHVNFLFPLILLISGCYNHPLKGPLKGGGTDIKVSFKTSFYDNSYALVIGINEYLSKKWDNLKYPVKDAKAIAYFLKKQNFKVTTLYDKQATKEAILYEMEKLANKVKPNDRIVIFFSGHGYTKKQAGEDWGAIVPYSEHDYIPSNYLYMHQLQALSSMMGTAKHQLFIMDSCYGGQLGLKGGGVDKNIPNYLEEITRRPARQVITAGGKDQKVKDGGPKGYSYFTGFLLEALEGEADLNNDGYITFPELTSYLIPRASSSVQTPATANLPKHGLGEFVFKSPKVTESGSFQGFEQNKGTIKNYCRGVWFSQCNLESKIVFKGKKSIRVEVKKHLDDPTQTGGTVRVFTSSKKPIDLSSATVISVWVYDTQGSNTVELKLCSGDNCSNKVWSAMSSKKNEWTEIIWLISKFNNVDKQNITGVEIYEWNHGVYYFDDISWQ